MSKQIGKTTLGTVETGLDSIPTKTWTGPKFWENDSEEVVLRSLDLPIASAREALERVLKEGYEAAQNNALPEHVRSLGMWLCVMAQTVLQKMYIPKVDPIEVAKLAFAVGFYYQRFQQWPNENPAQAGKRSRLAAKKKGRAAKPGSLRAFFNSQVSGWREMSAGRLLMKAQSQFPDRSQESLLRQIRTLKKSGR